MRIYTPKFAHLFTNLINLAAHIKVVVNTVLNCSINLRFDLNLFDLDLSRVKFCLLFHLHKSLGCVRFGCRQLRSCRCEISLGVTDDRIGISTIRQQWKDVLLEVSKHLTFRLFLRIVVEVEIWLDSSRVETGASSFV